MQIINFCPKKASKGSYEASKPSPENFEILFKYDIGKIASYSVKGREKLVTVTKEDKRVIFSNSKTLEEKLKVIEEMVKGGFVGAGGMITPRKEMENRDGSFQISGKFENSSINDKSIFGFTPISKNQPPKATRPARYRTKSSLYDTHQSLNYTPFKDLTSKTSSYMGNITSSTNKGLNHHKKTIKYVYTLLIFIPFA